MANTRRFNRFVVSVGFLSALLAHPCAAQPLFSGFDAGPSWNGLKGVTPKGEQLCMIISKLGDLRSFSIRISKLSTQLSFADPALATNSQVPARMELIVTQNGMGQPLTIEGMAKEIGNPGAGILIMEGAVDGPFLGILEKGSSLYVNVRGNRIGPYALVGINKAVASLRKCFSTL